MTIDPVRLLGRLHPPEGSEPSDAATEARDAVVLARVLAAAGSELATDGAVAGVRRGRRRRRLLAAAVAGTVLAGGAATALWPESDADRTRLACWTEPDAASTSIIEVAWDGASDPVVRCTEGFAAERLPVTGRLQPCDAGPLVVVVPGEDGTCERLGMVPLGDPAGD